MSPVRRIIDQTADMDPMRAREVTQDVPGSDFSPLSGG